MIDLKRGSLKLLDCTLRDGGQCLESNQKYGIQTKTFTNREKIKIAEEIRDSGTDIIEIGCLSETAERTKENVAIYKSIQEISAFLPDRINSSQIYTGVYVNPETPESHIPKHSDEFIDGTRVILRYSELRRSLEFCSMLRDKGYRVFIQPMLTMRYSDEDIRLLIEYANNIQAEALYIVDSFGYMEETDIKRIYEMYAKGLESNIQIGFHAHNNMENALSNVKFFVEELVDRNCIIDSCAMGMGQGAGNLQTEVAVNYLNTKFDSKYKMENILNVCDILDKFKDHDMESWGYSALRFIPAIHKTAYKYAVAMRMDYHMSLKNINDLLKDIPDELRHRYTPDNLDKLLKLKGYFI